MEQKTSLRKSLTARQVAETYGLDVGTLANLRYQKRGPKHYKVGSRKVLYWIDDVERWLKRQPVLTLDSLPEDQADEN